MGRPSINGQRKALVKKFAPTEIERNQYRNEWRLSASVSRAMSCQNYVTRECKRKPKRYTKHGVFCRDHYVNHPRCTAEECDGLAVIDPVINSEMLCRDHLFPDDDRPTPTWTRSMIADLGEFE